MIAENGGHILRIPFEGMIEISIEDKGYLIISAKGDPLGRLASQVAFLLGVTSSAIAVNPYSWRVVAFENNPKQQAKLVVSRV
jgi:hypothetical protein